MSQSQQRQSAASRIRERMRDLKHQLKEMELRERQGVHATIIKAAERAGLVSHLLDHSTSPADLEHALASICLAEADPGESDRGEGGE
ncbi:MAG: hypothetical protein ACYCS1_07895 [Gammaproteobacteria bacterium]